MRQSVMIRGGLVLLLALVQAAGCAANDALDGARSSSAGILQQGNERYAEGDLSAAAAAYEEVLEVQPDNVEANFRLGVINYRRGDYELAREQFEAARRSADRDMRPTYNLAMLHLQYALSYMNEYLAAVELQEEAIDAAGDAERGAGSEGSAVERLRALRDGIDHFRTEPGGL